MENEQCREVIGKLATGKITKFMHATAGKATTTAHPFVENLFGSGIRRVGNLAA